MARPTEPSARLLDALLSGAALLPGGANVVLQLAQPPVGHAVARSTVTEGSLARHPLKRTRTTLAYLAIALVGTDDERRRVRDEIDRVHARVRSGPDDPVAYDAFDPALQGWVAACLVQGARQSAALAGLDLAEVDDELYRLGRRLGTTLQVPTEWWPPTRAAFDAYWEAELERAHLDETTRRYLVGFVDLEFLPGPVGRLLAPVHRLIVGHFLPARLRDELGLAWDERRARRARILVHLLAAPSRHAPGPLRRWPFNWVLVDTRRRWRAGRTLL